MSDNMIYLMYLLVPLVMILAVILITAYYKVKDEGSIVNEVSGMFENIWNTDAGKAENDEGSFDQVFLRLFNQTYAYECRQADMNKNKYSLYKILVLLVIASVPFLMLFLVTKKELILGENEWNDVYLYTVIIIPVIFAYLLNKYISFKQYRGMWIQHAKIRSHMEWRMMMLIKDYEMQRNGMSPEESQRLLSTLKTDFMNDMCGYWKTSMTELYDSIMSREENLFQELSSLIGSK